MHIAICDDELFMRESIAQKVESYLGNLHLPYHLTSFSSGTALLHSDRAFDILFLDIQMDDYNGIDIAKKLRSESFTGSIVFVTVLQEYVFDAFGVEASDYLLKPIDDARLYQTMDRLCKQGYKKKKHLMIQKGIECHVILLEDIMYCEAVNRKIYIHLRTAEIIAYYAALDDLYRTLDACFFQCHRSYIVNLAYVRGYANGFALLALGEKIPVSRLRGKELTQAILQYMKGA